jgi:hypothetical protein
MSKEELLKWYNKLKVYLALHPDKCLINCGACDHDGKGCPARTVGIDENGKPKVVGNLHTGEHCIEWIKYV